MNGALVILPLFVAFGFSAWRLARRGRFCLHIAQLEGYKTGAYARWMVARPTDVLVRRSHVGGLAVLAILLVGPWSGPSVAAMAGVAWSILFISSRRYRRDRPKKPIAWTPRLTRLASVAALPAIVAIGVGMLAAMRSDTPGEAATWFLGGLWIADLGAPLWVGLASTALHPFERRVHERFKDLARRKLAARPDLQVVAITGSYGKTSVKFVVAEMLSQRYSVLASPGSFNTPMGICRVINDQLRPEHQVLVLEMGIRHPGDIAELCGIVTPDVAIITGIGIAHLASMGSQEAIAQEKGSLLDYLAPGGVAVLPADDPFYEALRSRAPGRVLAVSTSASTEPPEKNAGLWAERIEFGPDGTSFVVRDHDGRTTPVRLRLLGRHHVSNAMLGLAVSQHFGIRIRSAAQAAARITPVPHRLALREEAGLLILDDAFNSNPVGARNALEVLAGFRDRRRFVVTPGMIELGDREEMENEAFGRAMAAAADEVWLVGPERTRPIAAGLLAAGFAPERLHVVGTLFEARDAVRQVAAPGDVVLYENDLPDQYTEG